MAQNRGANIGRVSTNRTSTNRAKQSGASHSDAYVYGSAVRKLDVQRQYEQEPRRRISHETRKNREKARNMSLGYVIFLVAAFCTCAGILINYIQLQSELTNRTKGLAALESQLNNLRLTNDEEYSRIMSSIDLEEIKQVAIAELGMTYAKEGQIITYSSVENDYMRQVSGSSD